MKKLLAFAFGIVFLAANAQKKWSLQECVDYAVNNNLQVIQNNYNKQVQDKNLEMAKKQKLPGVSGSINNSANFGSQQIGVTSARNDYFNNTANISANVLLYNNGRLEKTVRKTEFDVQASQFDIETIKNNISLQVAQQYLSALLNKEIVRINESAVANAQKLYNRAKITTDVGTTAQTVLAEATASLAREKQNLKTAQVNVDRSLFSLSQLLMLPDYKNFDVQEVAVSNVDSPDISVAQNVLEKAYETQPQIKAAESRINSAKAQTEVTKTAFWPSVTASAGIGTNFYDPFNYRNDSFTKQYKDNFGQQLGLNASIPIFNKGITKLQVEQSKINEELAKNNLEQQKLDVKQSVQKAQFDADANYETYIAAKEAENSNKLALDFAEKSYEAGKTTIYDLNIARNNYANAQGSVAQAKYNYLFSLKLLQFYSGIPLSL